MSKLLDIIYYVIFLIKQAMNNKRKAEETEYREQVQENPSQAFQDKFQREDGSPIDYEDKDQ